jgi:hypothetical protein
MTKAGFAPGALEEALAEFVLELLDLLAEGGLGDVAVRGGAGKIAGLGDGEDVAELVNFHRQKLWIS